MVVVLAAGSWAGVSALQALQGTARSASAGRATLIPADQVREFRLMRRSDPTAITLGPHGALWFTELGGRGIGRITTTGQVQEFSLPTLNSQPGGITAGPDGALWFTETAPGQIGRITTTGQVQEFSLPTPATQPEGITLGPNSVLWFTEQGQKAPGFSRGMHGS
jgi:virginiamycin B lyase